MTDARSAILERIRLARTASALEPTSYDAIERKYRHETALDRNQILDLFEDRLRDYEAGVWRCTVAELPQTIASAATARNIAKMLVTRDVPPAWLPDLVAFVNDEELSYQEIDRAGGVLTRCAHAIAETGTIVLRHSDQEGRRALSLIPDYHLCVVDTTQVVASVVEGIRNCASYVPMPITTISGPSATSDIEMTRIKGVHGPRTLDVILVEAA